MSTGMLHFMSRAKGEAQARVPTDGSAITVPPVNVGGLLVVVTRSGGVFAFRRRDASGGAKAMTG